MAETKVTPEIAMRFWEQLETGGVLVDTDALSDRTWERLRVWLGRFDRGYKGGEFGSDWPRQSKFLYPYYLEYRKLHPKPIPPAEPSPRPSGRGARSRPIPDVSGLFDSMWVPDPWEMNGFDAFDQRTGFRIERVGSRDLSWQQVEGEVTRCWLRDEEEELLKEVLDRLPREDSERLNRDYDRLQSRMVEFVGQAIESQKGFAMTFEVSGVSPNGVPHLTLRTRLATKTDALIATVDEFIRSVKVAIIRAGAL
ncbi:MAG: hypothetical protein O2913_02230 [Chloroflexi bacterium]|nr:hypothetical protein [Chloroflexota bacterium]